MLFLRSVSNQADKLKQWVHQEVSECLSMLYLELFFPSLANYLALRDPSLLSGKVTCYLFYGTWICLECVVFFI